jgi:uncharacterized protein (DUF3084 family)
MKPEEKTITLKEHEDKLASSRKADQDLIKFIESERDKNIADMAAQIKTLKTEVDRLDSIIGEKEQEILSLNSTIQDKNSEIAALTLALSEKEEV